MFIRQAEEKDIAQLWEMMRDLAVFEKYTLFRIKSNILE